MLEEPLFGGWRLQDAMLKVDWRQHIHDPSLPGHRLRHGADAPRLEGEVGVAEVHGGGIASVHVIEPGD